MEQYIRSFKVIASFNDGRMVKTQDQVKDFTHLLEILLDDHGSVIDDLTQVFLSASVLSYSDFTGILFLPRPRA